MTFVLFQTPYMSSYEPDQEQMSEAAGLEEPLTL